jgi:isopentenyl diphosphate isomerase/L-lactate dehydrogenase-like FMN-dependent dehydrogenase
MVSDRDLLNATEYQQDARRKFLRFLLFSPLITSAGLMSLWSIRSKSACAQDALSTATTMIDEAHPDYDRPFPSVKAPLASCSDATNVFQFKDAARTKLTPKNFHFVESGADNMKTVQANREAFDDLQIRPRRLVDVSSLDTSVTVLGCSMKTPIILAPVGVQQQLHQQGELASARAAASRKCRFTVAMLSSFSAGEIAAEAQGPLWFQLYSSPDRTTTLQILKQAEAAGSEVLVVTVDGPVRGNREREDWYQSHSKERTIPRMGNLENLKGRLRIGDPSLTWNYIDWLRDNTRMKVVIKGIVTREDARLCRKHGADGVIVSNHGGRQEESNRGTIECLPEVVEAVDGRIPVLIDSGFRRGTDIFKALALGAQAICIGRPYLWGLATFGEDGVKKILDLLDAELIRIMKLAGTPSIKDITPDFVQWRSCHDNQS